MTGQDARSPHRLEACATKEACAEIIGERLGSAAAVINRRSLVNKCQDFFSGERGRLARCGRRLAERAKVRVAIRGPVLVRGHVHGEAP